MSRPRIASSIASSAATIGSLKRSMAAAALLTLAAAASSAVCVTPSSARSNALSSFVVLVVLWPSALKLHIHVH